MLLNSTVVLLLITITNKTGGGDWQIQIFGILVKTGGVWRKEKEGGRQRRIMAVNLLKAESVLCLSREWVEVKWGSLVQHLHMESTRTQKGYYNIHI